MNSYLISILLLLLLGAAAPTASGATHHTAHGVGQARQQGLDFAFRFRAESSSNLATGWIELDAGLEGTLVGSVDCLSVSGQRAVLSGAVVSPPSLTPYFAIAVKDAPKQRARPRDRIILKTSVAPISCADAALPLGDGSRIRRGKIVVD
jgi:hypothetical protein